MPENAGKHEGEVASTAPVTTPATLLEVIPSPATLKSGELAVAAALIDPDALTAQRKTFIEAEKNTAEGISRAARRDLRRNLYVASMIAANPLEESRDRLRALEFLAQTGRVSDPKEAARGKVLVVKVLTAQGAVEVRADGRE